VIEFPTKGLIFVSGQNSGGPSGFESIGAGKTSLGEALAIAVTGVRGRFSSFGHYSTKEKGNTLVAVEGTLGEQSLTIEMGYRCKELSKTGEGIRFTIGDNVISRSSVALTRLELSKTLGITPELAPWTTYVDGDKLDFSALSQSQSVELLMASLSQPSWASYHSKAKKTLDQLEEDIATKLASKNTLNELVVSTENSIIAAQSDLEEKQAAFEKSKVEMAAQLEVAKNKLNALKRDVSQRDTRRKELKKAIKDIEDELAVQFKELESKEMAKRDEKATIASSKKPHVTQERTLSLAHSQHETALRSLRSKPKECPTCRKPWDKGPSDEDIEKATSKVNESQVQLDAVRQKINEIQAQEDSKQVELDEIQRQHRNLNVRDRVRGFSNELDQLDEADRKVSSNISSLSTSMALLEKGPSDREVVKATSALEEKQKNLIEYHQKLESLTGEVTEIQELCKIVAYWTGAFSPTGIPNLVLARSVEPLNQISMALSHRLSGGTLGITYETTKELVSGEQRNCLNVAVKNSLGASRVAGNSKGESGLNNLIIAETINEVGQVASRVGFRWYDEVISNQDNKVRRAIINYLKETAHRLGILIFVVDHHPEVSASADYVLRATKDQDGVTTFKWVS
jgi:DNA repair exonuclease SbcCD ATPase subunit